MSAKITGQRVRLHLRVRLPRLHTDNLRGRRLRPRQAPESQAAQAEDAPGGDAEARGQDLRGQDDRARVAARQLSTLGQGQVRPGASALRRRPQGRDTEDVQL